MNANLRLALAQIDCTVGDLAGNCALIEAAAGQAASAGADVLLTPELSLCGYPPEDLVLRGAFLDACERALAALSGALARHRGLHVVVGHPRAGPGGARNCASVLLEGRALGTYAKLELPNYGVFDEQRVFVPGGEPFAFDVRGTRLAVNICEDTWFERGPRRAREAGAQVLLVPNGSPFHVGKAAERREILRRHVSGQGLALAYCNLAGAQDELVFDGGSFVMDASGRECARARDFAPDLLFADFDGGVPAPGPCATSLEGDEALWTGICAGIRAYVLKNRFPGVIVGLSGGIDSAVVLALAVDALGADRVRAVLMPSRFTAAMSLEDAQALAGALAVASEVISIEPAFTALVESLAPAFAGRPWDATEENLQARVRGTLLMALSNKTGSIVLTTGNKSETAMGYCTLYGDMAGGFAPIKDLTKRQVYALARHRNRGGEVIPRRILERAPSAELRPNQIDQDSLPPYDLLDEIVERHVDRGQDAARMIADGLDAAVVRRVVRSIRASEHKRRQAPPGVRVTARAFGRDWRFPLTNRYDEE
jgi:NAD+ synthase (glutamine-hydrolysing)